MHRKRSQRKKIIIGLICVLTLMSVGYAAFQGNLKIKGTTKITSLWDVRITNVTSGTPTGSAVNKIAPTWDGLTANMEADLYEKGDAMDYDVTITNNGTVDAVLSDIIGTPSNNEAVIITFSGYAKGEKLYKKGHEGNTKVVHVKIAYNPNYDGGETSGEASVEFNFTQAEGGGIDISDNKKLLTYDYSYNGGTSSQTYNEYVDPGTTVTLNKTASKSGWTFVGWNTNREAVTGMSSVKVDNDTTVYALFSKTITVTYTKGENVQSISKESDTCTLYNKQTSCSATLPTITPNEGYTCKWYTEATGGEEIGEGGATWTPGIGSAAYTRCGDSKEPSVGDIEGGEEAKGESQNLLLKATDESGIAAYYFGTTEPTSADVITTSTQSDLTAIQGSGLTKNITEEGTYWFAVKDEAGNFSKKSITIRKYQVQTVLEKIAGTTGTYNSTNYETAGTPKTYYVKDGTTLSLQDIYTLPEGGTADTFKGSTTSAPSTTSSSLSNTSKKITNDTSIYYMWFNRATYKVTVTKPTYGTVKAETVTKTGNSVTVKSSSSSDGSLTVKYGDTVKATATPNTNCTFEGWSGGYISGTTTPITGEAITENKTITATFKVLPVIKSWGSGASTDFHNSTYRTNITSIIFEDSINIPEGATSWDVSAVANSGAVMAWVTEDPEDSTKYVLHIAGEGGVIANTNSSSIFDNFINVKSINFNDKFDTSNATNMTIMFQKCNNLTSLDLGDKFDTSNVTSMNSMFSGCSSLTSLDLGDKFDTSNVTNMYQMFRNCSSLISLDLGDKFDTSSVTDMNSMFSGCSSLTSLDLGDKFDTSSVTNMGYMFSYCSSLTSLDLSGFDTSSVTYMNSMFSNCSGLTSLNLGDKFDTSSTTTMSQMFYYCSGLTSLDLGDKFDTSSVTSMYYMFYNCKSLLSLDLGDKFDTSNVTTMYDMFSYCESLTNLNLGDKFDTSSVTNMGYMFSNCSGLTSLNLGNKFDTSNVTNMESMFRGCSSLNSLDLGDKFDTSSVTNMTNMFNNCTNLKTIFAPESFVTTNVTSSSSMFTGDTKLVGGNGTAVATKQVYDKTYAKIDKPGQEGYFTQYFAPPAFTEAYGSNGSVDVTVTFPAGCGDYLTCTYKKDNGTDVTVTSSSATVNFTSAGTLSATVSDGNLTKSGSYNVILPPIIKSWTSSATTDFHNSTYKSNITSIEFENSINIPTGATSWDVSAASNGSVMAWVTADPEDSTKYVLHIGGDGGVIANQDSSNIFRNFANVKSINFNNNYDTSSTTNMEAMFFGCSKLTSLDLGDKFDTGSVTNMYRLFADCKGLVNLDLGENFDTSSVTNMEQMFAYCRSLTSLDLGDKFDTSSVTNMVRMFEVCGRLTSLNLGDKFDTSSVTNMQQMFSTCSSLTSIDLGDKFDTSSVTIMDGMFQSCSGLISLDLGNKFDTSSVTNMWNMFRDCTGLTSLNLGDKFDTSSVTRMQTMFNNCSSLTSLDLGDNFDTSSVTNMGSMFDGCGSLTSLDLGDNFDTSLVNNMSTMFKNCTNLETIYAPESFVTTKLTSSSSSTNMFYGDTKLVGGNGTAVATKGVYDKTYAKIDKTGQEGYFTKSFEPPAFTESYGSNGSVNVTVTFPTGCGNGLTCTYKKDNGTDVTVTSSSATVNFTGAGTLSATVTDGTLTKSGSYNVILPPIIKSWSSEATTDFHNSTYRDNITSVIFEDNTNIPEGATSWDVSAKENSGLVMAWVTADPGDNTKFVLHIGGDGGVVANTDSSYIFRRFTNAKSINFNNNFDTSNVTNMNSMFRTCNSLTNLNLGDKFDTSMVTDMQYMFSGCYGLISLNLGDNFDTNNVTNMRYMFNNCSGLTNLDLGDKFDTSSVTNMYFMFYGCSGLTSLDLGDKFDTSSVTTMQSMFNTCSSLTSLNLGDRFDTNSVTNMGYMFHDCDSLISLDLGDKFDTSNVTNMGNMFYHCVNLEIVYAPESFVTTKLTSSSSSTNMFTGDTKLVGGNGTAYATKQVDDKTYAKIDKAGQEGYFTQTFAPPRFTEAAGSNNSTDVTITFPSGCGNGLTCTYKKNNGEDVTVTSSSVTVNFTEAGTLSATISNGSLTKSGTYTVQ